MAFIEGPLMDVINGRYQWTQLMYAINAVINDKCH